MKQVSKTPRSSIIHDQFLHETILRSRSEATYIKEILAKATELKGLSLDEAACLCQINDENLLQPLFDTAQSIKEQIYGKRLVLFAPLYISNLCTNECLYCAFRARNTQLARRSLTQEEIHQETLHLLDQGHKRVLLVAGESYPKEGFDYVLNSINTIYATSHHADSIRRLNVNIAPLTQEEFKVLAQANIGTYQLFQETYHRETYEIAHPFGKKADYDWRVTCMDRAMQAGIDDVGIGVLFGLYDWRFEVLALLQHAQYLELTFGVGPHTISIPRLEPAYGSPMADHPPSPVSDIDFRKIIAILRLAVPYTGLILSTRESPSIRKESFSLGISQISAGSRTNPGGYAHGEEATNQEQFSLGDHRSLDEVARDIANQGYIPSFCTACYRLGRTGKDFMDLAKPGDIKNHCEPNALLTFQEYLIDYASPETRIVGEQTILNSINHLPESSKPTFLRMLNDVQSGKRDVYC